MYIFQRFKSSITDQVKSELKRFRRDEDGGLIVFSLFILVSMLVLGGMAVDFMRQENQRVVLQGVADRSVLAAASLQQTINGQDVVQDYFEKAGAADAIVGTPTFVDNGNSKRVSVTAEESLDTFFLRLIGIDQLSSLADASAVEAVGKVEISLVVDISGSMRFDGENPRPTQDDTLAEIAEGGRIYDLRTAAKAFATTVLDPVYNGEISLNIIPYAGHTNPGPEMFEILNGQTPTQVTEDDFDIPFDTILPGREVNLTEVIYDAAQDRYYLVVNDSTSVRDIYGVAPRSPGSVSYPLVDSLGDEIQVIGPDGTTLVTVTNEMITAVVTRGIDDPITGEPTFAPWMGDSINIIDDINFMLDPGVGNTLQVRYSPPHACMELEAASNWTSSGPPVSADIVPQFMRWDVADWEIETGLMGWGWCPHNNTSIKYAMQTVSEAVDYIDDLQLFDGTGTNNAMKWGLATLDPDMQPNFERLYTEYGEIVEDFRNRPAAYNDIETRKILILMTDGRITNQYRPVTGAETDIANIINPAPTSIDSYADWAGDEIPNNAGSRSIKTADTARTNLNGLCTLAKGNGISVYTVAFEISGTTDTQAMRNCATPDTSEEQYYFETAGSGLTDVFQEIAEQVSDLRLER